MRTHWSDDGFSHRNLTASEIASEYGFLEDAGKLYPTIYHPLPPRSAEALQAKLHEILRAELASLPGAELLVLPEVQALTGLKNPIMDLPVGLEKAGLSTCFTKAKIQR
jgi:hypothetical protein